MIPLEPANASQRRTARKLVKEASEGRIDYILPEPILTGKNGGVRFYPVRARRKSDGEEWDYILGSCYGSYRGWFPGGDSK
jgi:hypothetical protein